MNRDRSLGYLGQLPDQRDRAAVVTGANGALGGELTKVLASKGATVVMACRNLGAGRRVREGIRREQPQADLQLMELDLGSLASVRRFAEE
jgi:NAD(P)-dependent dehydrogenase (short-subunit alcohol dehydrogenase family)